MFRLFPFGVIQGNTWVFSDPLVGTRLIGLDHARCVMDGELVLNLPKESASFVGSQKVETPLEVRVLPVRSMRLLQWILPLIDCYLP